MGPVVSKVFVQEQTVLRPDLCSFQVQDLFLVASYRSYSTLSPNSAPEPVTALNLCGLMCVHMHFITLLR